MHLTVKTGVSVEDEAPVQLHPLTEVQNAKNLIEENVDATVVSNSPDFISTAHSICRHTDNTLTMILDGVDIGDDIEKAFEDYNKSINLQIDIEESYELKQEN